MQSLRDKTAEEAAAQAQAERDDCEHCNLDAAQERHSLQDKGNPLKRLASRSPSGESSETQVTVLDEVDAGPQFFIGAAADQGERDHMEDRHIVLPNYQLRPKDAPAAPIHRSYVGVFDGHRSENGAKIAAARLHAILADFSELKEKPFEGEDAQEDPVSYALKVAYHATDFEIVQQAKRQGEKFGTTAVTALQLGNVLYVAHAGDSVAVLGLDGRATKLTKEHKPDLPEEKKRIESKGGRVNVKRQRIIDPSGFGSLNMSRCLGDPQFKEPRRLVLAEPAIKKITLRPHGGCELCNQCLILATDGLWDVMSPQEAVDLVEETVRLHNESHTNWAGEKIAKDAAKLLVRTALKAGTRDNITVVVCLMKWES